MKLDKTTIKTIINVICTILTALGTAITSTSCINHLIH